MPYSLATLDRITQRFERSGTSLFIRTFDGGTLVHEFEFTGVVPGAPVPVEVSEVARDIRVRIARNTTERGTAVLVNGTVTVPNVNVAANSLILLTSQIDGGTVGFLRVSARTAGTSFVITSSSATDTSTVGYMLYNPE